MTNKKCIVPEKSTKINKPGYEEIHIPAPQRKPMSADEKLIHITSFPVWMQPAFGGIEKLNRVQSKLARKALETDENFLLCAPTGAGKTNVALLAILRAISENLIDPSTAAVDKDSFKIVYIAPMKALVQEMVTNFSKKLAPFGLKVSELTGDAQLTRAQIAETQVLVTTPEKWDVITRKNNDTSYTRLVRLVIIDEIHLLHDDRGPVLEAIVARTLRQAEETQQWIRLVGLSATLPNYVDVGHFLRVDPKDGIFYFDSSYRPCPLAQQFIGVNEKRPIKRMQLMNDIVYEKVMERAGKCQILVFVHSRKDTVKTAKAIRDAAIAGEAIGTFLSQSTSSRNELAAVAEVSKSSDLKDLLPYGFATHHAGMARADRNAVEELFAAGHIQVLVSTATLAWGVNLPAHTVIIKGTQVYNPEKGRWCELSSQDVLQMLGRAGRPQFDTEGEGIIITTQGELQFYLSLLNQQLPIESQLMSKLVDNLNAEIVLGGVRSRQDAINWLGYTYLYVRMLRDPLLYGVTPEQLQADPYLRQVRRVLAHSAALVLERTNMIRYDRRSGVFRPTELARIASHYYIGHHSMATYNQHLKSTCDEVDLFRVFALSQEFKLIPVRQEEKVELLKLSERVPIPIRENYEEPVAKVNILLQAHISQLSLEGFALAADMVYVTQSAGRILRAIFEMCLRRGWARLAHRSLELCKMVEKRMWRSMTPLRQLGDGIPAEILRKLERKDFPWDALFDLNPQELSELIRTPKAGRHLYTALRQFPRVKVETAAVPLTRELLRIDLVIRSDFEWSDFLGRAETFWLLVEDIDGETILYSDTIVLKRDYAEDNPGISFSVHVPIQDPLPPAYFVTIVSDRWLGSECRIPVMLNKLVLPDKRSPVTELAIEEESTSIHDAFASYPDIIAAYDSVGKSSFDAIQATVFPAIFKSDENILVCARGCSIPGNSGLPEFAVLRALIKDPSTKVVYIIPKAERIPIISGRLGSFLRAALKTMIDIVEMTGDSATDLKLLERGNVIISTPPAWDQISRRWRFRKNVQAVSLIVVDGLHHLTADSTIEVILSRSRFMSAQLERPIRTVALSIPLWNTRDVAGWLGIPMETCFNFDVAAGSLVTTQLQTFNLAHNPSMLVAMTRPVFAAVRDEIRGRVLVWVADSKQARRTAADLAAMFSATNSEEISSNLPVNVKDENLADCLKQRVAFADASLDDGDLAFILQSSPTDVKVVVASRDMLYRLPSDLSAVNVIVMGTYYYSGKVHLYGDYPVTDVFAMLSYATDTTLIMAQTVKRTLITSMLEQPYPLESSLDTSLTEHINAEVSTKTIESKQEAVDYLTWSYLYRRLARNPNFYGLSSIGQLELSEYLSELVEDTVTELSSAKCISVDEETGALSPLNLGLIAAYYGVRCATIEMFALSLTAQTKIRGILECVAAATEFDDLQIHLYEPALLERLNEKLPMRLARSEARSTVRFYDPHVKANLLLQAHFSRISLPLDMTEDSRRVILKAIPLVQAIVDVLSSLGHLAPAISAMEFSQMCIQAIWSTDPPIRQLPFFDGPRLAKACQKEKTSVYDLDESLLVGLAPSEQNQVAAAANRFPAMEVSFGLDNDTVALGEDFTLRAAVARQVEVDGPVIAPFYPRTKEEAWWLLVGDPTTRTLLGIKRFIMPSNSTTDEVNVSFSFIPPQVIGQHSLKLYLVCDCYAGADQEFDISVNVDRPAES